MRPSRSDIVRTPAAEAVGSGSIVDTTNVDDDADDAVEEEEESWRHRRPLGEVEDDAWLHLGINSRLVVEQDFVRTQ